MDWLKLSAPIRSSSAKIRRVIRRNKRKVVIVSLIVIIILSPLVYLTFRNPGETQAWWNDDWHYRKSINITNSGSADANKKVKLDVDTAGLVDPDGLNFHVQDVSFTENMAKRDTSGNVFAASPIVQGDWTDEIPYDTLTYSRGTAISGAFYPTYDDNQGSLVFWVTPEWDGDDGKEHNLIDNYTSSTGGISLYKTSTGFLRFQIGGTGKIDLQSSDSGSWQAGNTYLVVLRWDLDNTLDGTNYACITVDNSHTFGDTSVSGSAGNPDSLGYVGSSSAGTRGHSDAIIEGLTVYRRPLYEDETPSGVDVGNENEISQIYNSGSGQDPTLVTGSWDVVFALPTNSSTGTLTTGTGEAWTHPHSSNLLPGNSNTGGFMLDGTYTNDGWADEGSPSSVSAVSTNQKVFAGGYAVTSDAVNEGIYDEISVTSGDDFVVRGIAHSDGTAIAKILVTGADNGEITSLTATGSASTRAHPDNLLFTFEADATENIKIKLINTQSSGTVYWHQVEVLSNSIDNPSLESFQGTTPDRPTSWDEYNSPGSGDYEPESSTVHSGSLSMQFNTSAEWVGIQQGGSKTNGSFYGFGMWSYGDSTAGVAHFTTNQNNLHFQHVSQGTYWNPEAPVTATWNFSGCVYHSTNTSSGVRVAADNNPVGERFLDDLYLFELTSVSLTVTAATEANSTESTGLRVDGRDATTQTISHLTTTSGTIKFEYTPRHDAADALDFLESTDVYIGEWYGDSDDYIRLYWNANNSITLAYSMNGSASSSTYNATGAISAGTTYEFEIGYTGGSTMYLDIDGGSDEITLSSIPSAFGTAPTTAHWGKRDGGSDDRQADAAFDHITQTSGTLAQADCDDIRFTDANGNELKYYIDTTNGACNTASTDFYVLVPTIHANDDTQIFMYYGNPSAITGTESSQLSQSTFTQSATSFGSQEKSESPSGYWAFNEGYGVTAQDSTSNNDDGTISGSSWIEESRCLSGKCLSFDGTDDVVTVTNANPIDMNEELKDEFTYQTWVRVNSDGENSVGEIFDKGSSTYLRTTNEGSDGYVDLEASVDLSSTNATVTATNGLKLNDWHHVALVYTDDSDDEITLYIDGKSKGTSTNGVGSPAVDTNDLLIGGPTGANFDGFIDEFKVYPYTRTAAQIKTDIQRDSTSHGSSASFSDDDSWLSDGLVGYWKMDESSLNSCSGGEDSCDSSGNGNHGTWQASMDTTDIVTGKYAKSADLDGIDDVVDIGEPSEMDFTPNVDEFTLGAWVKVESGVAGTIISKGASSVSGRQYQMYVNADTLYANIGGQNVDSGLTVADGNWHHAAVVNFNDSGTLKHKFYVDGVESTVTTVSGSATNGCDVRIGARWDSVCDSGTAFPLEGTIDEVRIYNRVLSPAEVQKLYNWAPGPAGYWKFDEGVSGDSQTVYDSSGNGNNGTTYDGANNTGMNCNVSGKYGKSCEFDDVDDYITVPDSNDFMVDDTDNFTVMTWIYTDALENSLFISKRTTYPTLDWQLGYSLTNDEVQLALDSGGDYVFDNQNVSLTAGTWYHIAFTKSGTNYELFINGVSKTTDTSAQTWTNSDNFTFGNYQPGSPNAFDGRLDEIKIYNYVRTQEQIVQDMNAGHPAPGSPVGSPVGYWRFDEGYGDTAYNSGNAGSTINGDLASSCPGGTNCPTWTNNGKFGKALDFESPDWSNDHYVDLGVGSDGSPLDLDDGNFTLSAWANLESVAGGGLDRCIVCQGDVAVTRVIALRYDDTDALFEFEVNDGSGWQTAKFDQLAPPSLATWYHVVGVRDGSTIKIYVDGVLGATTDTVGTIDDMDSDSWSIGRLGDHNGRYWDGQIDEVKVYNFALTEDQVKVEYNHGKAQVMGKSDQDNLWEGLVGYWKLDESSTGTRYDSSGRGNDLTDNNTVEATGSGKFSYAGDFEYDNSEYLNITDNTDLSTGDVDYTITAWAYMESTGVTHHILNKEGTTTDTFEFQLAVGNGNPVFFRWATSPTSDYTQVDASNYGNFPTGEWAFITAYHDSQKDEIGISVNGGDFNTTVADGGNDSSGDFRIGKPRADSAYWDGYIDEVRVYKRLLSPAEVRQLYDWAPGPIAHWKMDEGSGNTAYDSSGNGYYASLLNIINGPSWVPGKYGNAFKFSSTTAQDYWDAGDINEIDSASAYTISSWINVSVFDDYGTVFGKWAASDNFIDVKFGGSSGQIYNTIGNDPPSTSGYGITQAGSFSTDEWFHFASVFDGDGSTNAEKLKIYINGIDQNLSFNGTIPTITDDNSSPFRMGAGNDFTLDDVRIYNYARSQKQILEDMMGAPIGGGRAVTKPVGHWRLNECEGTVAHDSSGNGNHGTITIGGSGDNAEAGTCTSGDDTDAWYNGASGKRNASLDFDGTDDIVATGADPSGLDITGNISVSGWINLDTHTNWSAIVAKDQSDIAYLLGVDNDNKPSFLLSSDGSAYARAQGDTSISMGTWYHIVGVYNGTDIRVYLNGKLDRSSFNPQTYSSGIYDSAARVIMGDSDQWANNELDGQIDDVRIYNYALSQDEIYNLYTGGAVRFSE